MSFSDRISFFETILDRSIEGKVIVKDISSISGGCIHNSVKVQTIQGDFFVKMNQSSDADMFDKEFMGLRILREANEINLPVPIRSGIFENTSFLITAYLESGIRKKDFWKKFGQDLAKLHLHLNNYYGLDHDNYIGRLPQKNTYRESWIKFFINNRLEIQVRMAVDHQLIDHGFTDRFKHFYKLLPDLLPEEPPSLLHGDLWSGNFITGPDGYAALIDPAVYYGNREIELSFTQMFGGFDSVFYGSYSEIYPLQKGFDKRVDIYNLYPYLVHLNMFGRSYLNGVERVINRYL